MNYWHLTSLRGIFVLVVLGCPVIGPITLELEIVGYVLKVAHIF